MKVVSVGAICLALAISCKSSGTTSFPPEGSGGPFASGSAKGRVEGSSDFEVSNVVRDKSGAIRGTLTYTGSCNLVRADLRFTYAKGDQTLTGKQVEGFDRRFEIGPLAPNEPYSNSYLGEDKVAPDTVIFVMSNERCA